jgi:hypothetical protein
MMFDLVALAAQQDRGQETGLTVTCHPVLDDPTVIERQHRAVCLVKPYVACGSCPNSRFTLLFKGDRTERFTRVACPRWESEDQRMRGEAPAKYVTTEEATCQSKPFPFCVSCPSRKELQEKYGADKTKEDWFGRFKRLRQAEFEDE